MDDVRAVDRAAVQAALRDGAHQVIEVLPAEDYRWAHLPGAMHVPLDALASVPDTLDPTRPIITYCNDFL